MRTKLISLGCAGVALALTGCQTYQAKTEGMQGGYKAGQIQSAIDAAQKQFNSNRDSKDTVVTALELAALQRTAALADLPVPVVAKAPETAPMGAEAAPAPEPADSARVIWYKSSLESFNAAREKVLKYDEQAKVSVGKEAGALMTNLANLPYKGKGHDRVMAETYAALNYLALGQADSARVQLNRVLQAQRDAVEANGKRIEEAQKASESSASKSKSGEGYDTNRALQDPKLAGQLAQIEESTNNLTSSAYANYVNPFSVFLDGLFFVTHAEGGSDLERAHKSFERVAGMITNDYTQADLAMANDAANGKLPENLTYVVFETGSAPHLEQIRIDIPLFIVGANKVPYVGAAFPKLATDSSFTSHIVVGAEGQSYQTLLLGDMDAVVAQSFKNEWPVILTKTLISTGVKATIEYVANNEAQKHGGMAGLLVGIGTGLLNYATTIADTRTWTSLPKQFQYCRFNTPADRTITVEIPGGAPLTVTLPEGKVNLVYVKSVAPGQPLYIEKLALSQ